MKQSFQIEIETRGEGISYREGERQYHFDISLRSKPYVIYADEYWDGTMPVHLQQLSESEKEIIIPRLIAHLKAGEPGAEVVVRWERDSVPLRPSREIFLEKKRSRGIKD